MRREEEESGEDWQRTSREEEGRETRAEAEVASQNVVRKSFSSSYFFVHTPFSIVPLTISLLASLGLTFEVSSSSGSRRCCWFARQ